MKTDDGGPATMVPVGGGQVTLVSDKDLPVIRRYQWRANVQGYAVRNGGRKIGEPVLLHRFILRPPAELEIHHVNGDRLDNRRCNLQLISGPDHRRKHIGPLLAANERRRKYPRHRDCEWCEHDYFVHQDHRGVSRFCSKSCASKATRAKHRKVTA